MKVELTLIDPWDLVTENGSGPFSACVVQLGRDDSTHDTVMLLEVDQPFTYEGQEYRHFVASPRLKSAGLEQLRLGKRVGCNITGLPAGRVGSGNPFDLSWWRGRGAAGIAEIASGVTGDPTK